MHGYQMTKDEVDDIFAELLGDNKAERIEIRGLSKARGDIIIGGVLPIVTLLTIIDSNKVIFSQSGIREGVLFATIEELTNQHVLNPEARQLTIDAD